MMTRLEANAVYKGGNHFGVNWVCEFFDGGWVKEFVGPLDNALAKAWELEVLFEKKVRIYPL